MPEPKRVDIASRMVERGYNPNIVYELTQEGLTELERRLDELKLLETKFNRLSQRNWISWLLSPRGRHQ
jgi:DNA-binding PadR family transcriptional regulator